MFEPLLASVSLVIAVLGGLLAMVVLLACAGARPIRHVAGMALAASAAMVAMTFATAPRATALLCGALFVVAAVTGARVVYGWILTGDMREMVGRGQMHWSLCSAAMALMMLPASGILHGQGASVSHQAMGDAPMAGMPMPTSGGPLPSPTLLLSAILSVLAVAITAVQVAHARRTRMTLRVADDPGAGAGWHSFALLGQLLVNVSMIVGVAAAV